jgi:hypothetical protein
MPGQARDPGHAAGHFRQVATNSMTCWLFLHPLHDFCIFYIHTFWAVQILSLGVLFVHILFLIMHFILIMVYFLL